MSISFPYQKKLLEGGEVADPRVIVEAKTIFGFLKIKFLLDSGADVTTLPFAQYAELFHFKKDLKRKVSIGGIEGKGVAAYPFSLNVRFAKKQFVLRSYFVESKIDPLLGRLDLWNMFSICFDNKNRKTIIIPIK